MKKSLTKSFFLGLLTAMFAVTNLHATTYTVAGDAAIVNGTTAWDETNTDNDMTELGDGTYQLVITDCELRAGTTYKFKVVQDHDWNSGSWPSEDWVVNDYSFTETAIYTLTYTFNPSTGNVGFTATKTSDIWTVVGSATNSSTGGAADALFGTSWDPTLAANDMTDNGDGTWSLTLYEKTLTAGTIAYKVTNGHAWAESYPESNATLAIPADGTYGVKFTFNTTSKAVTATLITPSAKAIWCAGNTTLYFTYDTKTYAVGDTYDGQTITDVYGVGTSGYSYNDRYDNTLERYHSTAPWDSTADTATDIVVASNFSQFKPTSYDYWFIYFKQLTTISGSNYINTSDATSLVRTFWNCSKLTDLDVSNWDTSKVTNLESTFSSCSILTGLDVSNWNTSKVTNLKSTFSSCSKLTNLDLSNWDTSKVADMQYTFYDCSNLASLDVSNWNTSKVTNIKYTFYGCSKLANLDVRNWNTSEVTSMQYTFNKCSNLTTLDLSNWNTSKVTNMLSTFSSCSKLTTLDVSNWDTSKVTNLESTFSSCGKLTTLDLSKWDISNVTTLKNTFRNCSALPLIDVSKWNTSKVNNMESTFENCSSLSSLDVSNWNTSNVTTLKNTFKSCSKLTSLGENNVGNWNTSKVTTLESTFDYCSKLISLDVTNWNTSNVTTLNSTFKYCSALTLIDVSKWNTSKVNNMASTFLECTSLSSLEVSNWKTSNVTTLSNTFRNCRNITSLGENNVANWDISKVTDLSSTFWYCSSLLSLDVSKWNTSNVTTLSGTFYRCVVLTSFGEENVGNWDTSKVTNMSGVFNRCSSITSLDVENWDTSKVTNMNGIFANCSNLTALNVYNWNTKRVKDMESMCNGCSKLTSLTFGKDFSTSSITTVYGRNYQFSNCSNLRYIDFYDSDCTYAYTWRMMRRSYPGPHDVEYLPFSNLPYTTIIYLPHGSETVTDKQNVVYSYNGDETDLRCPDYYSEDKVDIELKRPFKANKAQYTRTMSKSYGSVILPYEFSSNEKIQAYTLDDEYTKQMFFKDAATVPAHTPFAFKKLSDDTTADFTMTDESANFGITVNATRSTHPDEISWDGQAGAPYTDAYGATESAVKLEGWTTKGYYVNQTFTPQDEGYSDLFYIASEKFYRANGETLTFPPHRVTFHGAWTKGIDGDAKSFDIITEEDLPTAIEATEIRQTVGDTEGIYDTAGRRLETLRKGVNIVRMNDGSVRKVFIK